MEQLSDDVLAQVLELVDMVCHIRFWCCGDKTLNWRLARVIRSSKLSSSSTDIELRWSPIILHQLRSIKHLEFEAEIIPSKILQFPLKLLPQNLNRLTIRSSNIFDAIRQQLLPLACEFGLNRYFPLLERLDLVGSGMFDEIFTDLPSLLTFLTLVDPECVVSDARALDHLPDSIEDLKLLFRRIKCENATLKPLPSRLQLLDAHSLESGFEWLLKIPSTVQHLYISVASSDFLGDWDWSKLPKSLETFSLRAAVGPVFLPYLSPSLTHLACEIPYDLRIEDICDRFPHLKFLSGAKQGNDDLLARLAPSSLSYLRYGISMGENLNVEHLSRSLKMLDLTMSYHNETISFPPNALPPALLMLVTRKLRSEDVKFLPPSLTILVCQASEFNQEGLLALPRGLKKLSIPIDFSSDANLSVLPSSLISLSIHQTKHHDYANTVLDIQHLADKLEELRIFIGDSFFQKKETAATRSVQPFFEMISGFHKLMLLTLNCRMTNIIQIQLLPKSLRWINFWTLVKPSFDWSSFPPYTTDLTLAGNFKVTREDIAKLPKTLRILNLSTGNKPDETAGEDASPLRFNDVLPEGLIIHHIEA
jgi:hypothetical protein